jgi:hypothetical protein
LLSSLQDRLRKCWVIADERILSPYGIRSLSRYHQTTLYLVAGQDNLVLPASRANTGDSEETEPRGRLDARQRADHPRI